MPLPELIAAAVCKRPWEHGEVEFEMEPDVKPASLSVRQL